MQRRRRKRQGNPSSSGSGDNNWIWIGLAAAAAYWMYENYQSTGSLIPGILPATTTGGVTPYSVDAQTGAVTSAINIVGPVTPGPQGSLQANVNINGVQLSLAVVPNGDAFNPVSWSDLTAQLASMGVTPAEVYNAMSADYTTPTSPSAPAPAASTESSYTPPVNPLTTSGWGSSHHGGGSHHGSHATNPIATATGAFVPDTNPVYLANVAAAQAANLPNNPLTPVPATAPTGQAAICAASGGTFVNNSAGGSCFPAGWAVPS